MVLPEARANDVNLLSHEYAHIVQHHANALNEVHWFHSHETRSAIEGWADAFVLSYNNFRRVNAGPPSRGHDALTFTSTNGANRRRHSHQYEQFYFGLNYPHPQNDDDVEAFDDSYWTTHDRGPCRDRSRAGAYACGSIVSQLYWDLLWNRFPLGYDGRQQNTDIYRDAAAPNADAVLAASLRANHTDNLDVMLEDFRDTALSLATTGADAGRVEDWFESRCINTNGTNRKECHPRATYPELNVPANEIRQAAFSDGPVTNAEYSGVPNNRIAIDLASNGNHTEFVGATEFSLHGSSSLVTDDPFGLLQKAVVNPAQGAYPGAWISFVLDFPIPEPQPFHAPEYRFRIATCGLQAIAQRPGLEVKVKSTGSTALSYHTAYPTGSRCGWNNLERHAEIRLPVPPGSQEIEIRAISGSGFIQAVVVSGNCGGPDVDADGIPDDCDDSVCAMDADGDRVCDTGPPGSPIDNCPSDPNPSQDNVDGDLFGDACDPCVKQPHVPGGSTTDADDDGYCSDIDQCDFIPDDPNMDRDKDGIGDRCDPDVDGDGGLNAVDLCPLDPGHPHADANMDGVGDDCECVVRTDCTDNSPSCICTPTDCAGSQSECGLLIAAFSGCSMTSIGAFDGVHEALEALAQAMIAEGIPLLKSDWAFFRGGSYQTCGFQPVSGDLLADAETYVQDELGGSFATLDELIDFVSKHDPFGVGPDMIRCYIQYLSTTGGSSLCHP